VAETVGCHAEALKERAVAERDRSDKPDMQMLSNLAERWVRLTKLMNVINGG
jgi:hypothetical protein